jgi:phosphoglycolate phosphatase
MVELVDSLKAQGVKVGIASSKPLRLIYNVADHLGITEKFDAVVGVRMDDSNHSTKTGLILEAMETMGASDKNEVLMVGDRLYDIEGAKGAGVKSCGVLWGYGSEEEFRQYEADFIVKEAKEVLGLVKASK